MVDLIFSWVAAAFAQFFNFAIELIVPVFGFDFDTFARAFPFASVSYTIFQRVALAIALLVAAYHLFPFFMTWFGIRAEQLRSTPIRQLGQAVLAVIMIYYGNYILSAIIELTQLPFNAILYADIEYTAPLTEFRFNVVVAALNDVFYGASILMYIILLCLIGFSLIKVLLEAVERYVILFVLVYLSPLFAATLASEETSSIYSKFFSMFLSQCLLMLLNIWTIKMAVSLFANLANNNVPILALLMGYAFLRIAQRMDSYLNQLGLNAAVTGAGLGNELFATGAIMMGKLSGVTGGRTAVDPSQGNAGGGVLGASQRITSTFGRYNPLSAAGDIAKAGVAGVAQTARDAFSAGVESYNQQSFASGPGKITAAVQSAVSHAKNNTVQNIQGKESKVDNIFTRMYNNTKDAHPSASNSSSPNPSQSMPLNSTTMDRVPHNAHTANKVFETFSNGDQSYSEPREVASVIEGLGIDKISPAMKQFVDAGYGNIESTNKSYTLGAIELNAEHEPGKGLQASFIKNGKEESLTVVGKEQYLKMDHQTQHAYTGYKNKDGAEFYYKYESKKPTPTQSPKEDP